MENCNKIPENHMPETLHINVVGGKDYPELWL